MGTVRAGLSPSRYQPALPGHATGTRRLTGCLHSHRSQVRLYTGCEPVKGNTGAAVHLVLFLAQAWA
jgi:hypothetical protein